MPHKRSSSDLVARFDDLQPFSSSSEIDEYFNHERIECLLCSRQFAHLGVHLARTHGISADTYEVKLGLPLTKGLVGTHSRQKMRSSAIRLGRAEKNFKNNRGTDWHGRPERSLFKILKNKEVGPRNRARNAEIRKERIRRKLLEALRHCSYGMSMISIAEHSGISYDSIKRGLQVNRDIRAAFMELTR